MTRTKVSPTEDRRRPCVCEKPAPIAYRISAAAEAIGVGRTKLYQLIAAGKIMARKRDGVTFILADDLKAYISGGEVVGSFSNLRDINR